MQVVCPQCSAVNRIPPERPPADAKCGQCHRALFSGHPLALDREAFQRHLERSDVPLLVDFWAAWCGPCQIMAPYFEQAAGRLEPQVRLAKVNTEEVPELARQFGIRGIPTLILFKGGVEAARISGAMDLRALLDWTRKQL